MLFASHSPDLSELSEMKPAEAVNTFSSLLDGFWKHKHTPPK
jgi:hypothetical protein